MKTSVIPKLLHSIEQTLEPFRTEWKGAESKRRKEILEMIKPLMAQKEILEKVLRMQEARKKEVQKELKEDEKMLDHQKSI